MAVSPAEIRNAALGRSLFGFRRREVEELLERLADAHQELWQERVDLRERIDGLESEVKRHRDMEELLRRTLVSAEKSAADQKEAARQEAQRIVREAEQEAREILGEAHHQRAAVWRDMHDLEQRGREIEARYRAFLTTAAAVLDEAASDDDRTEEREPLADAITMH
jgi:cell division initiation protein